MTTTTSSVAGAGSRAATSRAVGALAALVGAVAWALTVASTDAARAAELALIEAGVPPGEDPSSVDSAGTVDLVLHDTRLGAVVAVLLGVVLLLAAGHPQAQRPRWPLVVGAGAALVVGNAVVAPLLGEGPAAVVVGATALLAATAAGCAAGRACGALVPRSTSSEGPERHLTWCLVLAGTAAGTAGSLGVNGLGEDWGYLLVRGAAVAAALAAAALTVLAVVAVLLVGSVPRSRLWPLAVAAAAPGVVSVGVLLPGGSVDDVVLVAAPLLVVLLPGGILSMALTAPAGAEIGADGLPLVGGGTLSGLVAGLVLVVVVAGTTGELAATRTTDGTDGTDATDATRDEAAGLP